MTVVIQERGSIAQWWLVVAVPVVGLAVLLTGPVLGLASLILVLGVLLVLTRGVSAPVRRMVNSVALLSSGHYSHRLNDSRGHELGRLTKGLDHLAATLEANRSSRKRLLADISRQFRTPLTILAAELDALQDGVREFDARQLDSLSQEIQRLNYLADDLYQLSLTDVGGLRYQFATVDLLSCAQQAIAGVSERAAAQGVCVCLLPADARTAKAGMRVTADAQRIDQLLQYILANAIAYTHSPARVVVSLSRTDVFAVITVEGVAAKGEKAGGPQTFYAVTGHKVAGYSRAGGADVDFAFCKRIAAAHGGSIAVSDAAIGGLSIRIEIPLFGE